MSCSCSSSARNCGCGTCRGVKLNQFAATTTISTASQFVMASNKLVSYQTLLNDIKQQLNAVPSVTSLHYPNVVDGIWEDSPLATNANKTALLFNGLPLENSTAAIVEVSAPYAAMVSDQYIIMSGGHDVALLDPSLAVWTITISATDSDVALTGFLIDNDNGIVRAGKAKKYAPTSTGYTLVSDVSDGPVVLIRSSQDWVDATTDLGGNVRQLGLNITYQVSGLVSRAFDFKLNGFNTIQGTNPNVDIDNYTGTSTSFSDAAAFSGLTIIRCSSKGVAGLGSKFISQTNAAFIISADTAFVEYDDLGTTDAIIVLGLRTAYGSIAIPVLSGLVITSVNTPTISFVSCAMRLNTLAQVTGLDFTTATAVSSISIGISFSGGTFAGSIGVKGAPNSANLIGTARGLIKDCNFGLLPIPLSGITIDDLKWELIGNRGIQDTMPDGYVTAIAGGTTTIGSTGIPVKIVATFTSRGASHFTVDASGRITYTGLDDIRVPIDLGMSTEPVSGTNQLIFTEIAKNGVPLAGGGEQYTRAANRVDNADPKYSSTFTQITMSTGDYIEGFVGNDTSNTNVICTNIKFRVN